MRQPNISTRRLLLRPFELGDASQVQKLAGDVRVADTTHNIPHPYLDGMAEEWISGHRPAFDAGTQVVFAITLDNTANVVGAAGLNVSAPREAELGYWVGVPYWNQGVATEATKAVIDFGFSRLALRTITGWHLVRNPGSGRVMQKAGMRRDPEGQKTLTKNGREESLISCSIHCEDWEIRRQQNSQAVTKRLDD